jgi:NDP-sugar pyrophosphorylase family protein
MLKKGQKRKRNLVIRIVFDYCRASLHNSILCSRSTVGSKCDIQNSIVCSNQQVEANREWTIDGLFLNHRLLFLGKLNGETISAISNEQGGYMVYDDEQWSSNRLFY